MDYIIETKNLHKSFPLGNDSIEVLKGIDLKVPRGKLTILKGRSGSGKTTLLNILSLLDGPTEGTVLIDGEDISQKSDSEKEKIRRYHMGFVFQSVALVPILSAYENVEFGMKLAEYQGDRDRRIKEVLGIVGLSKRMSHMPIQMSGGEQQRVAIARAVGHSPKIIFADEPTGALDTDSGIAVMKLFKELVEKEGITILMTTHDPNLMQLGDVVYEMEDGLLAEVGTTSAQVAVEKDLTAEVGLAEVGLAEVGTTSAQVAVENDSTIEVGDNNENETEDGNGTEPGDDSADGRTDAGSEAGEQDGAE